LGFLQLAYELIGRVAELVFQPTAALIRPATGQATGHGTAILPVIKPSLSQDTLRDIVTALKADEDAAAHLPSGWRGYYVGISDEPSPDAADRVTIGSEVRLMPEPIHPGREEAVRVVANLADRSTVQLGYLGEGHELGHSIELGRVRGWFAGHARTVTNPAAAMIFAAEYDS
jgi:hypothetical protein